MLLSNKTIIEDFSIIMKVSEIFNSYNHFHIVLTNTISLQLKIKRFRKAIKEAEQIDTF